MNGKPISKVMSRKPIFEVKHTFEVKDEDAKEMGCVLKITKVEQHGDTDYFEVCYLDTRDGVEIIPEVKAPSSLTPEKGRFIGRSAFLEGAKIMAIAKAKYEKSKAEARLAYQ